MIVSILNNFLGDSRSHYERKSQVSFDCPMCSEEKGKYDGDGKGNLEVNYAKGVYKCWSCWERNNMYGTLVRLIKKYGTNKNLKDYLLIAPKNTYQKLDKLEEAPILQLPKGYKKLSECSEYDNKYKQAYEYVKSRGISDDTIKEYQIGYTIEGKYRGRIIVPSFDVDNNLNYFIARSFEKWMDNKYLNPEARKELIIFNENKINWDSTIYLVEGAFDHIVTPNSIPLLGKLVSDKLFMTLQTKAKGDIILVMDGGEIERKDSMNIYKKLNALQLFGRVKVVDLKDEWDLSLMNEKYGVGMIVRYLKTAHKLLESRI